MKLDIVYTIPAELRDQMWDLYDAAFSSTNLETPCRQSYNSQEFVEKVDDPEVVKFLVYDKEGNLAGFSLAIANLDKLVWINKGYFEKKYPEYYPDKIFYVPSMAVRQDLKGTKKYFAEMVRALTKYAVIDRGGVVAMDCSENVNAFLPTAILHYRGKEGSFDVIDRQLYVVIR